MNNTSIIELNELNKAFYEKNSDSFSNTRQKPWDGWIQLFEILKQKGFCDRAFLDNNQPTILDIGCGNLRFEHFLDSELKTCENDCLKPRCVCIDSCNELLALGKSDLLRQINATCASIDVIDLALKDDLRPKLLCLNDGKPYDAICAFGFFHHIPTGKLRIKILRDIMSSVNPKGIVCMSLWRFLDEPKSKKKADATSKSAEESLNIAMDHKSGDRILGWQNQAGAYRFCHGFSDSEIEDLIHVAEYANGRIIARFFADGKNNSSNEYLVFQKNS